MEIDYGKSPDQSDQSDQVDQPEKDEQDEQQNDQSGPREVGKADMVSFPSAICGGLRDIERHAQKFCA